MAWGAITLAGEGGDPVAVAGMDAGRLAALVEAMPRPQWRALLATVEKISIGLAETETDLNRFLRDHAAFFAEAGRRDPAALERLKIAAAKRRQEKGWRAVPQKRQAA